MSDEIDTSPDEVEGAARFAESDYIQWYDGADLIRALAARIEELEAKLVKAENFIVFLDENYRHVFGNTARQKIRELYAELKKQEEKQND